MTHDEKTVDKLLRSLQPPQFHNEAHQDRLWRRLDASVEGEGSSPDAPNHADRLETFMSYLTKPLSSPRWRWAAAALVLLFIGVLFWGLDGGGSSRAFAAALQRLREATKMSCVVHVRNKNEPELTVTLDFMAPNVIRKVQPGGVVAIVDLNTQKGIVLFEAQKKYMDMSLNMTTQSQATNNVITTLRALPLDAESKKLGTRKVNGIAAEGYRLTASGANTDTWLDPRTGDLLEVDFSPKDQPETQLALTDIKLDPPLDDARFSLKPPAGYTSLAVPDAQAKPTDQDLAALLGFWAKYSKEKQFPESLNVMAIATRLQAVAQLGADDLKKLPIEERVKVGLSLQRAVLFLAGMDQRAEWQYVGKGMSPRDGGKPVFWWRAAGAEKFRIIMADLSIKELAEKDFPMQALYKNDFVRISESSADRGSVWSNPGDFDAKGQSLESLIGMAQYNGPGQHLDVRVPKNAARYDVRVKLPKNLENQLYPMLRQALTAHFGLTTRTETRQTDVYVLTAPGGRPAQLREPQDKTMSRENGTNPFKFEYMELWGLSNTLGNILGARVLDETGLTGKYDYEFNPGSAKQWQPLAAAVLDQLHLVLSPAKRELKFLIVEQQAGK